MTKKEIQRISEGYAACADGGWPTLAKKWGKSINGGYKHFCSLLGKQVRESRKE